MRAMTRRLRAREQPFIWVWAVLSLGAIYVRGQRFELDRHVTNRLQFHAIPVALSVLYHGRPHDYTAFSSVAFPFQSPTPDVDSKIAAAISQRVPPQDPTYYWAADDRGMADYVIAAFGIFGPHSKSLYYFYFVVLGCSVLLFLADLGGHPLASAMLLFALSALYVCISVIPLGNLTLPIFEPGSLYEPRLLELLSYVATLHLALTAFFKVRWTTWRRAIVAAQAIILVACYHARSTVGWQVAFLMLLTVARLLWRPPSTAAEGETRRQPAVLAGAWPLACVVAGLLLMTAYHRVAFNQRYFRDIGTRIIWHNALMGLSFNERIRDTYGLRVDDRAVIQAVVTYLRSTNDPRLTPEWTDSNILGSFGGHSIFNWFTYEGAARDLYSHIWRTNTRDMLHLYLVDKPREIARVLVKARRPDPDFPQSIPGIPGLRFNPFARGAILIALPSISLIVSSGAAVAPLLIAVLLLLACSVIPALFFYPVVHTMIGAVATVALAVYLVAAEGLLVGIQAVRPLRRHSMRLVQSSRALFSFMRRNEVLRMIGLSVLTLVVAGYFAPRGFRAGFTDMAHDGYQLREVLDLDRGGTIFKDTFDQYGPLSGYLNVAAFRMFGRNLLAVKYAICLWYALTSILLYLLARQLLTPALSGLSVVLWLALAPFYGHGIMISPHAYVLFFQTAATLAIVRFAERRRPAYLVMAGLCCGLSWALKTSTGVLFAAGAVAYLALRLVDGKLRLRSAMAALSVFLGSAGFVVAVTLGLLAFRGALHDWYLQTIVFPKAFYVDQTGPGVGTLASGLKFTRHFLRLNFDLTSNVPVALYWHLVRVVVAVRAAVLWRRRSAPDTVLIAACVAPVLWLAAYPSANYMHQWWLTSVALPSFVYCVQEAVQWAAPRFADGRFLYRQGMLTTAALAIIFSSGFYERWQYARARASELTETLDVPPVLRGIHTDKETLTAFRALDTAIRTFKRHHPDARIASMDHCDGYTNCVPESLLWLSFTEDNTHDHPVYWPIPVLTDAVYPDYWPRFRNNLVRSRPLLVDSWAGPSPPDNTVSGYTLLVRVRTEIGYWYLFAPDHPEASAHGEVQVRLDASGVVPTASTPAAAGAVAKAAGAVAKSVHLDGALRHGVGIHLDGDTRAMRRLYTWPGDIEVPGTPPYLEPLDGASAGRAKIVKVDRDRWVVHGSAEAHFSYLLFFKERAVHAGEYFMATGHLDEGGFSIGLQRDETWSGLVHVTEPGAFAVVLMPDPGRYNLVVANNVMTTRRQLLERYGAGAFWKILTGATLPNAFEIDRAGWISVR